MDSIFILERYPKDRKYALGIFQDIQQEMGYISEESLVKVSEYLEVPISQLYAMVTFYRAFSLVPRGKHIISVCDGTACHIRGSVRVMEAVERLLGLKLGETTADGLFSLEEVNCVGACAIAPVMVIDNTYYGNLTEEVIEGILNEIRCCHTAKEEAQA